MLKLTEEIKAEIKAYIESHQPELDFSNMKFDNKQMKKILGDGSLDTYIDDLWERNLEAICEAEGYLIEEIQRDHDEYDPEEIAEFAREFICVGLDGKNIISQMPQVQVLVKVHSNYDCCNSMDDPDAPEEYLSDVYRRVADGVKKEGYVYEFHNGAYGGSIFCFGFSTDIESYFRLMEEAKSGKTITIPKGTQFGFHSSFQGACSMFEKKTFQDMTMPIDDRSKSSCDNIGIVADLAQGGYSLQDVCGGLDFDVGMVKVNGIPVEAEEASNGSAQG